MKYRILTLLLLLVTCAGYSAENNKRSVEKELFNGKDLFEYYDPSLKPTEPFKQIMTGVYENMRIRSKTEDAKKFGATILDICEKAETSQDAVNTIQPLLEEIITQDRQEIKNIVGEKFNPKKRAPKDT